MRSSTAVAACLVALLLAGCGDSKREGPATTVLQTSPTAPPATQAGPAPLRLEPGRIRARERGLPLLVLVGQPGHVCPPANVLRDGLCSDTSLDDVCVRVLVDGGPEAGAEELRLVTRVRGIHPVPPALVVATPELEILHVQSTGLMALYSTEGVPLPDDPGHLLSAAEVRVMVADALARKVKTDRRLAELAAQPAAPARLERAEVLAGRGRWEEAESAVPRGIARDLSVKEAVRLYDLLIVLGDRERAAEMAGRIVGERVGQPGAGWMLLRLLRGTQGEGAREQAKRLDEAILGARASGCHRLEACLRALRVRSAAEAGAQPLPEDLTAADEAGDDLTGDRDREGAWRDSDLAQAALRLGDADRAERYARRLLKRHPGAPEALQYLHGGLDAARRAGRGLQPGPGAGPGPVPPQPR